MLNTLCQSPCDYTTLQYSPLDYASSHCIDKFDIESILDQQRGGYFTLNILIKFSAFLSINGICLTLKCQVCLSMVSEILPFD